MKQSLLNAVNWPICRTAMLLHVMDSVYTLTTRRPRCWSVSIYQRRLTLETTTCCCSGPRPNSVLPALLHYWSRYTQWFRCYCRCCESNSFLLCGVQQIQPWGYLIGWGTGIKCAKTSNTTPTTEESRVYVPTAGIIKLSGACLASAEKSGVCRNASVNYSVCNTQYNVQLQFFPVLKSEKTCMQCTYTVLHCFILYS